MQGRAHLGYYRARIEEDGKRRVSSGRRHFCRRCASALWLYDPAWPDLVHPFASAIDTALPSPPERVHSLLAFKAPWVQVRRGKHDPHFLQFPDESLADWHRRHGRYDAG